MKNHWYSTYRQTVRKVNKAMVESLQQATVEPNTGPPSSSSSTAGTKRSAQAAGLDVAPESAASNRMSTSGRINLGQVVAHLSGEGGSGAGSSAPAGGSNGSGSYLLQASMQHLQAQLQGVEAKLPSPSDSKRAKSLASVHSAVVAPLMDALPRTVSSVLLKARGAGRGGSKKAKAKEAKKQEQLTAKKKKVVSESSSSDMDARPVLQSMDSSNSLGATLPLALMGMKGAEKATASSSSSVGKGSHGAPKSSASSSSKRSKSSKSVEKSAAQLGLPTSANSNINSPAFRPGPAARAEHTAVTSLSGLASATWLGRGSSESALGAAPAPGPGAEYKSASSRYLLAPQPSPTAGGMPVNGMTAGRGPFASQPPPLMRGPSVSFNITSEGSGAGSMPAQAVGPAPAAGGSITRPHFLSAADRAVSSMSMLFPSGLANVHGSGGPDGLAGVASAMPQRSYGIPPPLTRGDSNRSIRSVTSLGGFSYGGGLGMGMGSAAGFAMPGPGAGGGDLGDPLNLGMDSARVMSPRLPPDR